jgi:thioredoxin reductase (NADPH)
VKFFEKLFLIFIYNIFFSFNLKKMQNTENVAIIGSGPAGYTAAIYCARAGLFPVLFEGINSGGQLMSTSEVENYPGFEDGIKGPSMMEKFRKQALRFGTKIISETIVEVNFGSFPFFLKSDKNVYHFKSVIIATGSSVKWLNRADEEKLKGRGISSCATCDGFFYKNQEVAIVGGGDTAAEEALYLSNICSKVYLLVRSKFKASKIMVDRILINKKIEVFFNTEIKNIKGNDCLEEIEVENNLDGKKKKLKISGLFIAIGHTPNTEIFKNFLDLDENGYIKTKKGTTKTNIKGIFAAGDVQDPIYRQAITSAGSGCMAALEVEKYLQSLKLY